jgi:protein gp37
MSDKTAIEWTDATWNPIRGCSRVSEGCRNCYAESVAYRFSGPGQPYEGLVTIGANGERKRQWNGSIRFMEKHLLDPLKWGPVKMHTANCGKTLLGNQAACTCPHRHGRRRPETRLRRIFVNSMSDLFHDGVTDLMLDKIFAVMALCPQHMFQVLTKRPERMVAYFKSFEGNDAEERGARFAAWILGTLGQESFEKVLSAKMWKGLANVHLGVSVENQKAADERIPLLLQTPAAVRFISAEPLLGTVDLKRYVWLHHGVQSDLPWLMGRLYAPAGLYEAHRNQHGAVSVQVENKMLGIKPDEMEARELDWVICGGESGPGARPMHPDWARSLRDQCKAAGVPFFFKQWGEWAKYIDRDLEDPDWQQNYSAMKDGKGFAILNAEGGCGFHGERVHVMQRVGKKAAGALLDGVEYREMPR